MKINWFSPVPPANTGIAEYTSYLLPALVSRAEVVVWTDCSTWSEEVEQFAKVRFFNSAQISWKELNQADVNIYNIGNNPIFHRAIWEVSRQCPGLVVLHDASLQDFFSMIYKEEDGRDKYQAEMMRYYGRSGKQAAEGYWDGLLTADFMAQQYPLTPLALENALGVITHTRHNFDALKQQKPVLYAPLPHPVKQCQLTRETLTKAPPYQIIVFGYIGWNRCLDQTLKALSTLREKKMFHLNIYGRISNLEETRYLVKKLKLNKLVTLHNFVQESELDSALAKADIAINLRYPTMGEASLSQLRIWSYALPSLVTRVGWYAELPENSVAFVHPGHEISDIQQQLQKFIAHPKEFIQMGKNGQRLLEAKHDPVAYAESIVNFAKNAQTFRQSATAYKLAERAGKLMSLWGARSDNQVKRVAEAIHFITSW